MTLHITFYFLSNALVESVESISQIFTPDIFYFKKGEERFAKELNVVEFARNQRKLKMLMHSLMDDSERFLAPYQKLNAISLISETESSHSDNPSYTKVPMMLSKTKIKQKHESVVDKFFEKYLKEIHTEKDVYLLHGITSRKELSNKKQSSYLIKYTQAIENDKLNYAVNMEESKEKLINISSNREIVSYPSYDISGNAKNVMAKDYDKDEDISIKKNEIINQKSSKFKMLDEI